MMSMGHPQSNTVDEGWEMSAASALPSLVEIRAVLWCSQILNTPHCAVHEASPTTGTII
jgi:hypothetical protein